MYTVVVYSENKTKILKTCGLIEANNVLNTVLETKETNDYYDNYYRENYDWECKFNNTIRTVGNGIKTFAIVEIMEVS